MDFKRAFDLGRKKNMQGKWRRFEEMTGGIFGRCICPSENFRRKYPSTCFQDGNVSDASKGCGLMFEIKGLKNLVQKMEKMKYPKVWCVSNGFV